MKFKKADIKKIIKEEFRTILREDKQADTYRMAEVMDELSSIIERWDESHPYTIEIRRIIELWS